MYVISNNSTDTAETLSRRLAELGLSIAAEHILLAGTAAVEHIAHTRPRARLSVCGSETIIAFARSLGLQIDDEAPDTILLTRDTGFSYEKLTQLLRHVHDGAEVIVSNIDLTHPGADGVPVPETGSLLRWLKGCWPNLSYTVIGKPEINLYQLALELAAVDANDCLCIGDNKDTDGQGAKRMGMPFALVRLGNGSNGLLDLLNGE